MGRSSLSKGSAANRSAVIRGPCSISKSRYVWSVPLPRPRLLCSKPVRCMVTCDQRRSFATNPAAKRLSWLGGAAPASQRRRREGALRGAPRRKSQARCRHPRRTSTASDCCCTTSLPAPPPASLAERAPIRTASDWPELDELIAQLTSREPSLRPGLDGLIAQIDQLLARRDVPRMIGKWQIGRMLGEGSFGRVFSAENADISGLRAAIKVLHPFMARDRDMRRRFLNEASAASQIEHPSVVRVLDGGVEPGGVCYVAMELLQGRDLGERLARGPLALDVAVRLIREAAQALAVAHAQKIVHRDIKPSNLFIEERPEGERLRILDFGIALLRGEPTREGIPYTATGHIWGTPEYMAPEQWQMVSDLDRRVDIYSLGLVLWECLIGRRPFTASTVFEWQQAHLTTPLPSTLRSTPGVPARLASIIEQMLAKRREERISSMEEVVTALDEILKPPPTHRIDASTPPPPAPPTPSADTPAPPAESTTLIATITTDAAPRRPGNWTLIAGVSSIFSIGAILLYLNTRPPVHPVGGESQGSDFTDSRSSEVPNTGHEYGRQGVVFDPPSNVRKEASDSSPILCTVTSVDEEIAIGESEGKWYETNVCGVKGYIHRSQFKFK